jgi:hypothetical protein
VSEPEGRANHRHRAGSKRERMEEGPPQPARLHFGVGDAARIPGTTVDLDPPRSDEALRLLDDVEGSVDGLFVRVVVVTDADERAWAYQWGRSLDGLTRIDRWDRADEH